MRLLQSLWLLAVLALLAAACADDDDSGSEEPNESESTLEPVGCKDSALKAGPATFKHDGIQRSYVVALPDELSVKPAPLLFDFHGFGGSPESQEATSRFGELATKRGYVVVTAQGEPLTVAADTAGGIDTGAVDGIAFWNIFGEAGLTLGADLEDMEDIDPSDIGADDLGFVEALLDDLIERSCIDESRVYSAGMSNGAGMSATIACELGDRFAAVGPVSGVNLTGDCLGSGAVSIFAMHGDADSVAAYDGNLLYGFKLGNPAVPDRMAQLAQVMGCVADPESAELEIGVLEDVWTDCDEAVEVRLWTVIDGEHTWGGDFETSEELLDFFDAHPRGA